MEHSENTACGTISADMVEAAREYIDIILLTRIGKRPVSALKRVDLVSSSVNGLIDPSKWLCSAADASLLEVV